MNKNIPLIENLEDFNDPRAKSLLLEYDLPVEELYYLRQKFYKTGNPTVSPLTPEKSSVIKKLIASAVLCLELTKRDRILIPYRGHSYIVSIDGQEKHGYPFSFLLKREGSIESYERNARKFLKYAKRLERCIKHHYLGPLSWFFPTSTKIKA